MKSLIFFQAESIQNVSIKENYTLKHSSDH